MFLEDLLINEGSHKGTVVYHVLHVLLKGIAHPKMTILSSVTHTHIIPNVSDFLLSEVHKINF